MKMVMCFFPVRVTYQTMLELISRQTFVSLHPIPPNKNPSMSKNRLPYWPNNLSQYEGFSLRLLCNFAAQDSKKYPYDQKRTYHESLHVCLYIK